MQTNEANPPIVIKPDSHCVVTTASSHLHFAFDNQLAKLCMLSITSHGALGTYFQYEKHTLVFAALQIFS